MISVNNQEARSKVRTHFAATEERTESMTINITYVHYTLLITEIPLFIVIVLISTKYYLNLKKKTCSTSYIVSISLKTNGCDAAYCFYITIVYVRDTNIIFTSIITTWWKTKSFDTTGTFITTSYIIFIHITYMTSHHSRFKCICKLQINKHLLM